MVEEREQSGLRSRYILQVRKVFVRVRGSTYPLAAIVLVW